MMSSLKIYLKMVRVIDNYKITDFIPFFITSDTKEQGNGWRYVYNSWARTQLQPNIPPKPMSIVNAISCLRSIIPYNSIPHCTLKWNDQQVGAAVTFHRVVVEHWVDPFSNGFHIWSWLIILFSCMTFLGRDVYDHLLQTSNKCLIWTAWADLLD